eukprot:scaffold10409_cov123-Skeletonema_marinoi.AAC.1
MSSDDNRPKVQLRLLAREKVKVFDDVCGEKEKREGVICTYTISVLASKKEDTDIIAASRPASFLTEQSEAREIEKDWGIGQGIGGAVVYPDFADGGTSFLQCIVSQFHWQWHASEMFVCCHLSSLNCSLNH